MNLGRNIIQWLLFSVLFASLAAVSVYPVFPNTFQGELIRVLIISGGSILGSYLIVYMIKGGRK